MGKGGRGMNNVEVKQFSSIVLMQQFHFYVLMMSRVENFPVEARIPRAVCRRACVLLFMSVSARACVCVCVCVSVFVWLSVGIQREGTFEAYVFRPELCRSDINSTFVSEASCRCAWTMFAKTRFTQQPFP